MRCNNCGWNNPDGSTRCQKCNYPLDGSLNVSNVKEPTMSNDPSNDKTSPLSSTIQGDGAYNLDPWDAPNVGERSRSEDRPTSSKQSSGYSSSSGNQQNRDDAWNQSNNGERGGRKEEMNSTNDRRSNDNSQKNPPSAQYGGQFDHNQQNFNKTFDPSRFGAMNKPFRLKLIAKEGEKEVDRTLSHTDLKGAESDKIELNRANIDSDNYSITSKVQATLELIDGKWHIVDNSELKTTFIQIKEPHPLNTGDIILLGNRKIIFEED